MSQAKTALIVIDVQNYFVDSPQLPLVEKIAQRIKSGHEDYVLFTQFINRPGSNFERIFHWHKCYDSPEIDLHPLVAHLASPETTFARTAWSIFKSASLREFLTREGINGLSLCGLDTDACVLASAFEAFDLGYDLSVLDDLCGVNHDLPQLQDAALKIIRKNLSREGGV